MMDKTAVRTGAQRGRGRGVYRLGQGGFIYTRVMVDEKIFCPSQFMLKEFLAYGPRNLLPFVSQT